MKYKQKQLERHAEYLEYHADSELVQHDVDRAKPEPASAQMVEQAILRSAKNNGGLTTPTEVALESSISIEKARESLDYLVSKGFAEIRVNKSGIIVYRFPDIIDPNNNEDFEDLT